MRRFTGLLAKCGWVRRCPAFTALGFFNPLALWTRAVTDFRRRSGRTGHDLQRMPDKGKRRCRELRRIVSHHSMTGKPDGGEVSLAKHADHALGGRKR